MIWVTDRNGQCTYLCEEWYALTGQTPEQGLGVGWTDAVHPDDRSLIADGFTEACRLQTEFMLRYRLRKADGTYIWVLDAASPSLTPMTREFIGFLGMVSRFDDPDSDLTAKAEIGEFAPGKAMAEFGPISQLDIVADHLIMAKAVSVGCGKEVAAAIDLALHAAAQALVAEQPGAGSRKKPH